MFSTEIPSEYGFVGWAVQQILVPIAGMAVVLAGGSIAKGLLLRSVIVGNAAELAYSAVLAIGAGYALAVVVVRSVRSARLAGRLVWILPVVLLIAMIVYGSASEGLSEALREFFYPRMDGEEGLPFVLMTCPVLVCVGYSIRMTAASKNPSRPAGTEHRI